MTLPENWTRLPDRTLESLITHPSLSRSERLLVDRELMDRGDARALDAQLAEDAHLEAAYEARFEREEYEPNPYDGTGGDW